MNVNYILADGRWRGHHGIGRFSTEILRRLEFTEIIAKGPTPLSLKNLYWLPYRLHKNKKKYKVFFSPGFNPIFSSSLPFIFALHDLIHLTMPNNTRWLKKIYYETLIKPTALQAEIILTGSNYSKIALSNWLNCPEKKIQVINYGISEYFQPSEQKQQFGFPYLLHVGSTKSHKNIPRLIQAFANAKIDREFHLLLTGQKTPEITRLIDQNKLQQRVIFTGPLSEIELANYYRGATALVFPSLFEGFGLPVAEAMACGIPVLTSNTSSLPEVAGKAAVLVNPYEIDNITDGLEKIVLDEKLRLTLKAQGLEQAKAYSWDNTAQFIQFILNKLAS